MKRTLIIAALLLLVLGIATAQTPTADVLGVHNLTPGSGSSITMTSGNMGCVFCHAPHSGLGGVTPLWHQQLSKATYTPYTSTTNHQTGNTQPPLGVTSSLCLSCHDGTVALGQSVVFGKIGLTGSWNPGDTFGSNLAGSHPFSLVLPMKDSPNLQSSLVSAGTTADPLQKIKLINGNIECTSCHDPHVQATDRVAQNFLVRDSSSGQMCLACHDPNRVVQGQVNLLTGWSSSIHQSSPTKVAPEAHVGSYPTVAENACTSCHMEHNGSGTTRLLRPSNPSVTSADPVSQSCITCHNGGTYLSPAAPNVMSEYAKVAHPMPSGTNSHDANETVVLANNRHASCVDCHNAHGSNQVTTFSQAPTLRPSQSGAVGVSAQDGTTTLRPSVNQYENCLRCHGTGPGKQRLAVFGYSPVRLVAPVDALNVIPEFSASATSSHPVFHDRSSPLPQPSLLTNMIDLNGQTSQRTTTRIFCTDCHNSDDNREFGKQGPNGPHGSIYSHLLERNYVFSQAAVPGGVVSGLSPNPDLSLNGPYAMCAKCHNMSVVLGPTSWPKHATHVGQDGFSCSVCHTAHGMGATSSNISGTGLVNFDVKVVAQYNNGTAISYNRNSGTCTLTCHNAQHKPNGTVKVN